MSDVFDQAIDRVLSRKNREVYELLQRSGLYDNVATAIRGRKVLVRGKWLAPLRPGRGALSRRSGWRR
ncbi:hypothetical protein [Archangium lansingense]|uniref:Uncharacterized protein n=1 Tax=Archangium lansingense TaxID=2995310 RepID=A0ABT3ZZ56_9BACT|nr:hypothetical protein [Archangium lansinium]MCY1074346.1 hypothetical protein [Archangium lansinium]